MLKSGYLATNSIHFSIAHTKDIVNGYIQKLDEIFKTISKCEDGKKLMNLEMRFVSFGGRTNAFITGASVYWVQQW